MAERGTSSPAAAEVAAYRTRDAKDYGVDPDTQREEWISRAAEFDLTAESIDAHARRRSPPRASRPNRRRAPRPRPRRAGGPPLPLRPPRPALRAGQPAPRGCRRWRAGGRGRRPARRRAADRVHRGAGPLDSDLLHDPAPLAAGAALHRRPPARARSAGAAVVDGATLAAVLDRHRYLSAEQVEMVHRLTTGGERIVAVAARPGTGKTTALAAAREAWEAAGIRGDRRRHRPQRLRRARRRRGAGDLDRRAPDPAERWPSAARAAAAAGR